MSNCTHCDAAMPAEAVFCPECGKAPLAPSSAGALPGDDSMMTLGGLDTIGSGDTSPGARANVPLLEEGTTFADRYEILGVLGAGGMGVVYRAKDSVAAREVALKLVRPGQAMSESALERLIQEGVTARDIRHESVVGVYDVGAVHGQPYLTMEVVEGPSLRDWIRRRLSTGEDVSVAQALTIVQSVAEGLRAAHRAGVIHRDLKPENVILTGPPTGESAPLKVLDFGIALAGAETKGTGSGTGLGTPHYMAPEQLTSPETAGASADVYSLSVVLYEMLVGVLPQGHWQPPSGGRSDVPRALDDLVQEGLSNRPRNRPATMDAFLERLDDVRSGSPALDFGRRAFKEVQEARERFKNSFGGGLLKTSKKSLLIAVACVIAILGIAVLMDGEDEGSLDRSEDSNRRVRAAAQDRFDEEAEDDIDDIKGPRSDGPEVLSGTWIDVAGHTFDVAVRESGRFSGDGEMAMGNPASIKGRIQNGLISGQMRVDSRKYATFEGGWNGFDRFVVGLVLETGEIVTTEFVVEN